MTSKFLLGYAALAIAALVFGSANPRSIALLSANPRDTFDGTFNSRDQLLFSCIPSEDSPKKANSEDSV